MYLSDLLIIKEDLHCSGRCCRWVIRRDYKIVTCDQDLANPAYLHLYIGSSYYSLRGLLFAKKANVEFKALRSFDFCTKNWKLRHEIHWFLNIESPFKCLKNAMPTVWDLSPCCNLSKLEKCVGHFRCGVWPLLLKDIYMPLEGCPVLFYSWMAGFSLLLLTFKVIISSTHPFILG